MLTECKIRRILEFCVRKTENVKTYLQKDIWPNRHGFWDCHDNVKNYGHTVDISKSLRAINKQLLNSSASYSKFPFQNCKKTSKGLWRPLPTQANVLSKVNCNVRFQLTWPGHDHFLCTEKNLVVYTPWKYVKSILYSTSI